MMIGGIKKFLFGIVLSCLFSCAVGMQAAHAQQNTRHIYLIISNSDTIFPGGAGQYAEGEWFTAQYAQALAASFYPEPLEITVYTATLNKESNKANPKLLGQVENTDMYQIAGSADMLQVQGITLSTDQKHKTIQRAMRQALQDATEKGRTPQDSVILIVSDFLVMTTEWSASDKTDQKSLAPLLQAYEALPLPIIAIKVGNQPEALSSGEPQSAQEAFGALGANYLEQAQGALTARQAIGHVVSLTDGNGAAEGQTAYGGEMQAVAEAVRFSLPAMGRDIHTLSIRTLDGTAVALEGRQVSLPALAPEVLQQVVLMAADRGITLQTEETDAVYAVHATDQTSAHSGVRGSFIAAYRTREHAPLTLELPADPAEGIGWLGGLEISRVAPSSLQVSGVSQAGRRTEEFSSEAALTFAKNEPLRVEVQIVSETLALAESQKGWEVRGVLRRDDGQTPVDLPTEVEAEISAAQEGYVLTWSIPYSGRYTVQCTAVSTFSGIELHSEPIGILIENQAPSFVQQTGYSLYFDVPYRRQQVEQFSLQGLAQDPDGDALHYTLCQEQSAGDGDSLPDWITVQDEMVTVDLSKREIQSGTYTLWVTAWDDDPQQASAEQSITLELQSLRDRLRGLDVEFQVWVDGQQSDSHTSQGMSIQRGSQVEYVLSLGETEPDESWESWMENEGDLIAECLSAQFVVCNAQGQWIDDQGQSVAEQGDGDIPPQALQVISMPTLDREENRFVFRAVFTLPDVSGEYTVEAVITLQEDSAAVEPVEWTVQSAPVVRSVAIPVVQGDGVIRESLFLKSVLSRNNPPVSVAILLDDWVKTDATDALTLTFSAISDNLEQTDTRVFLYSGSHTESLDSSAVVASKISFGSQVAYQWDSATLQGEPLYLGFETEQSGIYHFTIGMTNNDGVSASMPLEVYIEVGYADLRTLQIAGAILLAVLILAAIILVLYRRWLPAFDSRDLVKVSLQTSYGALGVPQTFSLQGWKKEQVSLKAILMAANMPLLPEMDAQTLEKTCIRPMKAHGWKLCAAPKSASEYIQINDEPIHERQTVLRGKGRIRLGDGAQHYRLDYEIHADD